MPPFGAHMSVAGGLPRAVERAVVHHCDALQIFTKNANQWRGRPLPPDEVREFRERVTDAGLVAVVSHASYLINLATSGPALRQQSIDAMADELDRAEALGLLGVVLHPGCATSGSAEEGLRLVGEALSGLLEARPQGTTMVLLEHTAGQGTALGATFEQLAAIIDVMEGSPRVGVCIDTCHLLASGYDFTSDASYARTFDELLRVVGLARLKAFHLNDSKKPLGSRVDRHEHIGEGFVGLDAFRRLVTDPRFQQIPMLLETPKGDGKPTGPIVPDPLDVKNLTTLRALAAGALSR
jgi:deoxyribonuclease-4